MRESKISTCVIITNSKGEMALQLRAAHDDSFPSHWDFAAGGGIDKGENEKVSAEREIREELGVECSVVFVAKKNYTYPAWKSGVIRDAEIWLYRAQHDGPFSPDLNEVEKVAFFSLNEIQGMIQRGEKFHPEFLLVWNDSILQSPEYIKTGFIQEGFAHVYDWSDASYTRYPEHAHKGRVSFYVIRGSITFSGGISRTVSAGERFDVPAGIPHSALVGSEGCDWIVAEEIVGDS